MAFVVSKYMMKLRQDLIDKKNTTESTADTYIRLLVQLNNKKSFNNISFLKDINRVKEYISKYALSTRKNFVSGICSILSMYKDSSTYKKIYADYTVLLNELRNQQDKERGDTSEKTEKEKENWVEWEDVEKKRDEILKEINGFVNQKNITAGQYETLMAYMLLCLYTYLPPRRNADFQQMYVVREWNDKMPTDRNYLDLHNQQFIFNVYKTAKKHGQQKAEIPDDSPLREAIIFYLKHNAHYRASKNKSTEFRFLTKQDGTPLTSVNVITRVLNKLFKKRVGSSMLRHSYLSKKYGKVLEEMKEDSDMMAHDTNTQKTYIRKDDSESESDGE